jgi:hypothetical protein
MTTTIAPTPPAETTDARGPAEHVLVVVEPTTGGDGPLQLAHDVVARGGRASVLMLITSRVDDDIRAYAASEDLSFAAAEADAIARLGEYCTSQIGAAVPTNVARFGWSAVDLRRFVAADVTTVAVPEQLFEGRRLRQLAAQVDRPLVTVPALAA